MNTTPFDPAHSTGAAVFLLLADATLKSTVLLLLAVLVSPLFRKTSAAARHALWCGVLAGALILPMLSALLPAWNVPWLPEWRMEQGAGNAERDEVGTLNVQRLTPNAQVTPSWSAGVPPEQVAANEVVVQTESPPPTVTVAVSVTTPNVELSNQNIQPQSSLIDAQKSNAETQNSATQTVNSKPQTLLWRFGNSIWFLGVALALLPMLAGWAQAWRLTHRAQPLNDPEWSALLASVSSELQLRRPVRLLSATDAATPFTWGWWWPVVLFPASAHTWPAARRRFVLLHELGHVRRGDWLTQCLGAVACAIYWFNPLAWMAARQLRLEREQACDDLVLGSGSRPCDYARELLEFAANAPRRGFLNLATVPMARRSTLEQRLRAILDSQRNRRPLTRLAILALLTLVVALVVPMAMLRAAPEQTSSANSSSTQPAQPTVVSENKDSAIPIEMQLRVFDVDADVKLDPQIFNLVNYGHMAGVRGGSSDIFFYDPANHTASPVINPPPSLRVPEVLVVGAKSDRSHAFPQLTMQSGKEAKISVGYSPNRTNISVLAKADPETKSIHYALYGTFWISSKTETRGSGFSTPPVTRISEPMASHDVALDGTVQNNQLVIFDMSEAKNGHRAVAVIVFHVPEFGGKTLAELQGQRATTINHPPIQAVPNQARSWLGPHAIPDSSEKSGTANTNSAITTSAADAPVLFNSNIPDPTTGAAPVLTLSSATAADPVTPAAAEIAATQTPAAIASANNNALVPNPVSVSIPELADAPTAPISPAEPVQIAETNPTPAAPQEEIEVTAVYLDVPAAKTPQEKLDFENKLLHSPRVDLSKVEQHPGKPVHSGAPFLPFDLSAITQPQGTDVLSAPKVTVMSGRPATIAVTQQLRFPSSDFYMGKLSTTPTFTTTDIGVNFEVTPTISGESVLYKLRAKITELEGFTEIVDSMAPVPPPITISNLVKLHNGAYTKVDNVFENNFRPFHPAANLNSQEVAASGQAELGRLNLFYIGTTDKAFTLSVINENVQAWKVSSKFSLSLKTFDRYVIVYFSKIDPQNPPPHSTVAGANATKNNSGDPFVNPTAK